MIAWLHAHALMAMALAFVAGVNVGILMMSVFVSGREAPVIGRQDPEVQRAIARLIQETRVGQP